MRFASIIIFSGFLIFASPLFASELGLSEVSDGECSGDFCLVSSSDSNLRSEIKALKNELTGLKKEIMALKGLIESRLPRRNMPPARANIGTTSINNDPFMGKKEAPIVLVEFTDYECPFCGRHFKNTIPLLKKVYVETGKIRYVLKDFPLPFHKHAQKAAEATHCAGEEGKYWEMHDLLFENQKQMRMVNLVMYAERLGLEIAPFKRCMEESRYSKEIKADEQSGRSSGVTGTPSFLLGKVNARGEVEGQILRGAKSFNTFRAAIDALLTK